LSSATNAKQESVDKKHTTKKRPTKKGKQEKEMASKNP
jgi:hypothetical protein